MEKKETSRGVRLERHIRKWVASDWLFALLAWVIGAAILAAIIWIIALSKP